MKLLVIDGNSIINRAYFGIRLLTTKDGQYTNAIFGFLNTLNNLLTQVEPDEVAVAFDLRAPTFRHKMFDGYKATRKGMPPELAEQMPRIKEILTAMGFAIIAEEGWEADDLLGTLAKACEARRDDCFLATGDKDSLQLVSESTTVLLASTVMGKSQVLTMDEDAIFEKYGLKPQQLIDVKSLMGDSSDNIPGVKGIGEKTALKLIQTFGNLNGVYENLEDKEIKPKQRENLTAEKEMAFLSYELGTIRTDAPIATEEGAYKVSDGNKPKAVRLLQDLELHKLLAKFNLTDIAPEQSEDKSETEQKELPILDASFMPEPAKGVFMLAEKPAVIEKVGNKNVETMPAEWYAVQGEEVFLLPESELIALLDNPEVQLEVFHSAPLYALAMANGGMGASIKWDGKLAAYLLNASASGYHVGELIINYKAKGDFACEAYPDAGYLRDLFAKLKAELTEKGQDKLYNDIEFPLAQVLADITRLGVLVDKNGIEKFGVLLKAELENSAQRIYMQAGCEFNINSPKQLGEVLFSPEKLGLPHGKKTKTGWSTDAATLENLRSEAPIVEDILQYRTYQKLNSTYVEGLLKVISEDGRIHSTFNQFEARTGRLSSVEPNLQNIPIRTELGSKLREYFIAKEGTVFLDADYSQIELRILAHITGDKHMQEAFLAGQDIHTSTAAKIYGVPLEQVTPRLRSSAKAINFGIMYGKGAFSLSKDINVSVKEADAFLKSYLATFPKIEEYMESTIAEGKENGFVSTLFGRRRSLPELASSNFQVRASGERMARNTPIQGTAADIIKLAMVRVWRRLREENLESKLILTVHDELIVEAPLDEKEKASKILQEEMMGCANYAVPLTAEVGEGENWLVAH